MALEVRTGMPVAPLALAEVDLPRGVGEAVASLAPSPHPLAHDLRGQIALGPPEGSARLASHDPHRLAIVFAEKGAVEHGAAVGGEERCPLPTLRLVGFPRRLRAVGSLAVGGCALLVTEYL